MPQIVSVLQPEITNLLKRIEPDTYTPTHDIFHNALFAEAINCMEINSAGKPDIILLNNILNFNWTVPTQFVVTIFSVTYYVYTFQNCITVKFSGPI